jgi:hypothetical protein
MSARRRIDFSFELLSYGVFGPALVFEPDDGAARVSDRRDCIVSAACF